MTAKSQAIEITGIDTETLERAQVFPDSYAFYIKLSGEPDSVWQGYLSEWSSALRAMQREITIVGDKLKVVFVYGDDVPNCASYVVQLVEMINKRIVEHNKQVELQEAKEMSKQEAERIREEELLGKLKELEPTLKSTPVIETTVEELFSAYEADEEAAEARFGNAILTITGVVGRVEIKESQNIYYIALTSQARSLLQAVRCMFDKEHVSELNDLTEGETITVKGKYDGSIVDIRMRDCMIIH